MIAVNGNHSLPDRTFEWGQDTIEESFPNQCDDYGDDHLINTIL